MDAWKSFRLVVCIAVMLGLLAVGGYARLAWGVPEAPYGYSRVRGEYDMQGRLVKPHPATINPLQEIDAYFVWSILFGPRPKRIGGLDSYDR